MCLARITYLHSADYMAGQTVDQGVYESMLGHRLIKLEKPGRLPEGLDGQICFYARLGDCPPTPDFDTTAV